MHIVFLGKTDRLASQPLNVSSEIQILPLNFLCLFLSDRMLLGRYVLLVRLPVVCVEVLYVQVRQLSHQFLARSVITLADLEGQDLAASPAVGIPRGGPSKPPLASLSPSHPSPHLVDHHALVAAREIRLSVTFKPQPQDCNYGHRAHFQHSGRIADAATIHSHLADLALDARVRAGVSVLKLKLPMAVVTIEILLPVGLHAILFYIWRGAVRAIHFDKNVRHSAKVECSCAFL